MKDVSGYVGLLKYASSVCRDVSVFWRFAADFLLGDDFNLTENDAFDINSNLIN